MGRGGSEGPSFLLQAASKAEGVVPRPAPLKQGGRAAVYKPCLTLT